jgi:protein-tyrosine phosphatase
MFRILVVCVGNVCRSPMAVALLRQRLAGCEVTVESAGLAAPVGRPIHPLAETVLAMHGLSLRQHVASQIQHARVAEADLVLAMEPRHVAALQAMEPKARKKTFLLGKWHDNAAIRDPNGKDLAAFERAYVQIESYSDAWLARIQKMMTA